MYPCPPVFFRPIAFVSDRLINEAGRYLPPAAAKLRLLHRHGNSEVRNAVQKIAGAIQRIDNPTGLRSEEHTSELQSLMRTSYAILCLKKKTLVIDNQHT